MSRTTDSDWNGSDDWDGIIAGDCPWCGGEGHASYLDSPSAWGEDCPSEEDHLITCPECKGSGKARDCDVL